MGGGDWWRIVVLGIGAFDVFFTLFLLLGVVLGFVPTGRTHKVHVLSFGASYVLLAVALWLHIAGRAVAGATLSWRLPIATVAFPLGIFALWQLIRKH